jgi:hypothetical protein
MSGPSIPSRADGRAMRLIGGLVFFLALALAMPRSAAAFNYPSLDTTSHWTLQNWGFSTSRGFYIQGAEKRTWAAAGQPQSKTAFYGMEVVGARLNGVGYPFKSQDFLGEVDGDGYIAKYGSFNVTDGVSLTVVLFFIDDGKFEVNAYFSGAAYSGSQPWEIVIRMDYDMAGAGNNIAEFLWNASSEGGSISPPMLPRGEAFDGRLVYKSAKGTASGHWAAVNHEMAVAYPPLPREAGQGIENAGFARILNAAKPQFGMVLWSDAVTPVEAVFKSYAGFNGGLFPKADIAMPLQSTGEAGNLPRYAFAGRDQMIFMVLGAPAGGGTYKMGGKLFQRSGSRRLAVTVRQHPPEFLDGFRFDADRVLRYTSEGARTFRNALGVLTGAEDLTVYRSGDPGVPYLSMDGYPGHEGSITEAQLHNLMVSSRDYSAASLENVRDWRLDLLLVTWFLQGERNVWEAMFDYGNADANGISREGAAIFWPAMQGRGTDYQGRQASLSALRAAGQSLNMDPSWGVCPFAGYCWNDGSACGGVSCGSGCPSGASGCRYQAFSCAQECRDGSIMSLTDVEHNSVGFSRSPAPGSAFSEIDWYGKAPEAWVKPGRFGAPPISGPMPPFSSN